MKMAAARIIVYYTGWPHMLHINISIIWPVGLARRLRLQGGFAVVLATVPTTSNPNTYQKVFYALMPNVINFLRFCAHVVLA